MSKDPFQNRIPFFIKCKISSILQLLQVLLLRYWTRRCRIYDFELGHLGTLNFCYTPFVFHSLKKLWFEYHTFIFPCSIGQVGSGKISPPLRMQKHPRHIGLILSIRLSRIRSIIDKYSVRFIIRCSFSPIHSISHQLMKRGNHHESSDPSSGRSASKD